MNNKDKYYLLYEDRYRRIHDQGFDYWISSPEENSQELAAIDRFLSRYECHPDETSIIEFGCGQGFVAERLVGSGFDYLGVDVSEYAIDKAGKKLGEERRGLFLLADITQGLPDIRDKSFDIAIDNQCLHMLVTDEHRRKYLAEMKRLLKSSGKVFFRENIQPEEFTQNISSFSEWMKKTGSEYSTLYDYPAYSEGAQHTIQLPRVPARFNNEKGYRKELEEAGFRVEEFIEDGRLCIIYAAVNNIEGE